jgi:hypothetical protein
VPPVKPSELKRGLASTFIYSVIFIVRSVVLGKSNSLKKDE